MDTEEFSILMLGIISLVILYAFIGSLFEHKHVPPLLVRFTLFMRQELAS